MGSWSSNGDSRELHGTSKEPRQVKMTGTGKAPRMRAQPGGFSNPPPLHHHSTTTPPPCPSFSITSFSISSTLWLRYDMMLPSLVKDSFYTSSHNSLFPLSPVFISFSSSLISGISPFLRPVPLSSTRHHHIYLLPPPAAGQPLQPSTFSAL
jgi:hypothetical protein